MHSSKRVNGRTRDSLPIENPALRPCSAAFTVPTLTCLGSLTGYLSLLFSSLPLKILGLLYPYFLGFVNTQKKNRGSEGLEVREFCCRGGSVTRPPGYRWASRRKAVISVVDGVREGRCPSPTGRMRFHMVGADQLPRLDDGNTEREMPAPFGAGIDVH